MALTLQDLQRSGYLYVTGATADDILSGVNCRIMAVVLSHTGAVGSITIDDAATHGTARLTLRCLADTTQSVDLSPGGWKISVGLSTVTTGNATIFYVSDPT